MAVNYTTPEAMGAAIRDAARNTPGNTGDAIRRFYYDRFLCRIFSDDTSPFVLKGGQMLLARLSGARYTRDIDMVSSSLLPDEEVDLLIELTSKDLGDFISFDYVRREPIADEEEYRSGYKVIFSARLGVREVETISVDVVRDDIDFGKPDIVNPQDRITLPELKQVPYPSYPIEFAIADKVGATLQFYNGRRSSRIKDLFDLALICSELSFDAERLQARLMLEFKLRGIDTPSEFDVPPNWLTTQASTYSKMAQRSTNTHVPKTVTEAKNLVARCLNPVLNKAILKGIWSPEQLMWKLID